MITRPMLKIPREFQIDSSKLASLEILGDYNPYIPTTHNIGLIEGFSIGVRCRGTSNYPLMVPVIGGRIKL